MARTEMTTVVKVAAGKEKTQWDVLAVGLAQDTKRVPAGLKHVDVPMDGALAQLLRLGDFSGKANETVLLYGPKGGRFERVLVVGLGEEKKITADTLREAAGTAARQAEKLEAGKLALGLHVGIKTKLSAETIGQAVAEGAIVGRYDFREYLPKKEVKNKGRMAVIVVDENAKSAAVAAGLRKGGRIGTALGAAANLARGVNNRPGNDINPGTLASEARKLARKHGLRCKVHTEAQLKKAGMNGILAVGCGSANRPQLIELEYNGRKGQTKGTPDVVIVGKAITFDSGGISIKPSANMGAMKFDKSGGCNVLGIMAGAAQLGLKLRIVGLIPAAENKPSHTSYRPGDILRTYSGQTVEVDNTDAEGRLILCDALAYGAKMKPKAMVDMATLTGACVIALGSHHAGLFGNDDKLRGLMDKAGQASGERVWSMPNGPEYLEQMKSKIADLKNTGGREGGSCTAAAFLGAFVGETKWAHVDIAAVADTDKEKPYRGVGATGFGVRLVLEYLRGL